MDAFDRDLEFAQAGDGLVRGRQANSELLPNGGMPAGQPSAMATTPERDRRTFDDTIPHGAVSADQKSVPTKGRGRRAIPHALPTRTLPGGQPSGSAGDDGGAHTNAASRVKRSPAIIDYSGVVRGAGDDEGALIKADSQGQFSPLVVEGHRFPDSVVEAGGDEGAHWVIASPRDASPLVAEIQQLWRMRQRWHRAEKSLVLQGKAICRSWIAGDKDAADKLFLAAAKGEAGDPIVEMALMPFLSGIDRFASERAGIEKRLRKLAQRHSLWPWAAEVKGFGSLNFAAIVGEAGEVEAYRNPSCLWKRMGLAVIDGGRQRKVADAEAALVHGYAPARRCVAYLLGDTLIKAGDGCRYRPVYAARRERTAETHPDWTKGHSHNDAARYMVKRVLRDLWVHARPGAAADTAPSA